MDLGGLSEVDRAMSWQRLKELLGFGENCLNGGRKLASGICKCKEYFNGAICQNILCQNGAKAINNGTSCACPDSHFRGQFCQIVDCENGGDWMTRNEGFCDCPYGWYSGRFCESYSAPWATILGVVIGLVIFLVIVFIFCKLGVCSCSCERAPRDSAQPVEQGRELVDRRYSWRLRDRRRMRPSADHENEVIHPVPARAYSDSDQDANSVLLYLQSQNSSGKPPDYSPSEPPPPYEAVVGNMRLAQERPEPGANANHTVSSV